MNMNFKQSYRITARTVVLAIAALVPTMTSSIAQPVSTPHVVAELIAQHTVIVPGVPFNVALRLQMDSAWHTYWKNPGDAGLATTIEWDLPDGFTASDIRWPIPHRFGEPPEVSYGYDDEVLLAVEITPPADLRPGETIVIGARGEWLACNQICLKGKADLTLRLPVATEAGQGKSPWADAFARTLASIPRPLSSSGLIVSAQREGAGYILRVAVNDEPAIRPLSLVFFAGEESVIDHSAEQRPVYNGNVLQLTLPVSPYASGQPERLRGILVFNGDDNYAGTLTAVEVDVAIGGAE